MFDEQRHSPGGRALQAEEEDKPRLLSRVGSDIMLGMWQVNQLGQNGGQKHQAL